MKCVSYLFHIGAPALPLAQHFPSCLLICFPNSTVWRSFLIGFAQVVSTFSFNLCLPYLSVPVSARLTAHEWIWVGAPPIPTRIQIEFLTEVHVVVRCRRPTSVSYSALTQLYLRTLFILFLSALPPGGPGEGPDCHSPSEIVGFGPIQARIMLDTYFLFLFWP